MYKSILVFLVCFIAQLACLGQHKLTINYQFDGSIKREAYFRLLKPVSTYPGELPPEFPILRIDSSESETAKKTKCIFAVKDTSICLIADGFGHESFVLPDDELTIVFKKMKKTGTRKPYLLNGKYISPYFHEFDYKGVNKFIYAIFDSLAYNTGALFAGGDIGFKEVNHDIKVFFDTVTRQYNARLKYLNTYVAKHKIPKTIAKLAFLEVKADYIGNLLDPMQNIAMELDYSDYPKGYVDSLNKIDFDNSQYFFRSREFALKAFYYVFLYQNRLTLKDKLDDENTFKRVFNTINDKYKGKQVKEQLLATLLIKNYKRPFALYDSVINVYHEQYPQSTYKNYIDSLYYRYKSKPEVSLNDGLASQLIDRTGNKLSITEKLRSRPVIIDCWASWCSPCLQQFPYSNELEKKYAGKVDFIYVSFDKDRGKWNDKSAQLSLKNNSYLLYDNFGSNFASHFDVESIPRYIVFDKYGMLVNANAPRPSDPALEKLIAKLIAE